MFDEQRVAQRFPEVLVLLCISG